MKSNALALFAVVFVICIMAIAWSSDYSHRAEMKEVQTMIDASSPASHTFADGTEVQGGMAVLDPCVAEPYGAFGAIENGAYYPFANLPAVDPRSIIETRITHYGPPTFGLDNCRTATGYTPREALALCATLSAEWGLPITGFCAVSSGLPWYDNVRDEVPTLIQIQDHGYYLVLDRKGSGDVQGCDIYEPEQTGYMYCEIKCAWRIR